MLVCTCAYTMYRVAVGVFSSLSVCICALSFCAFSHIFMYCMLRYVIKALSTLCPIRVIWYLILSLSIRKSDNLWSWILRYASLKQLNWSYTVIVKVCRYLSLCVLVYILSASKLFFSLTDSKRGACNISGKYFSNNQTLVSICSVFLVVLQSLIWQHAVLIWLVSCHN